MPPQITTREVYTPFYGHMTERVLVKSDSLTDNLWALADAANFQGDVTYLYFESKVPDDIWSVAVEHARIPDIVRQFYDKNPHKTVLKRLYHDRFRVKIIFAPRWSVTRGQSMREYFEDCFIPELREALDPTDFAIGQSNNVTLFFRDEATYTAAMLMLDQEAKESIKEFISVVTLDEVENEWDNNV